MKSTGTIRKVDQLGRIVIPKELRANHNINIKDPLEIYVDGDKIVLTKYEPQCTFCGSNKITKVLQNKKICQSCILELIK